MRTVASRLGRRVTTLRSFSSSAPAKKGVSTQGLFNVLNDNGIGTYYGVPDSLLKDFAMFISDEFATENTERHVITANEGTAIGLAAGYYMGSGKPACVYLQNSGLGNVVNPIMSCAHEKVYGIPMLLMIGWRGEPGVKDEPQHNFMGAQTTAVLDSMQVKYAVLPDNLADATKCVEEAAQYMAANNAPYAILVRKGTFEKYKLQAELVPSEAHWPSRENAIKAVADALGDDVSMVSATGMPSRELYEHRVAVFGEAGATGRDFLTVGSMGCCSSIAVGVAVGAPHRQVVALDGDGGTIMHMGALVTNGQKAPPNFKHVILNNGAHDSVGGQPTFAFDCDLPAIAKASGYKEVRTVDSIDKIPEACHWLKEAAGPVLLEVRTKRGARSDLGRPKSTPPENRTAFMDFVSKI